MKLFGGGSNLKIIEKNQSKRTNDDNIGEAKKEEKQKKEPPKKLREKEEPIKFSGCGFSEKLKLMNDMFKKQEKEYGPRRGFSVRGPSSRFGFGNSGAGWKDGGNNNLGIIMEEPDKMKPGYDPALNLEKKLDEVIMVQKNKKKKKSISYFTG